jgi:hypothetical protein
VSTISCAGFCTSGSAPSVVSAKLSGDGRQIALAFDQDVSTTGASSPAQYFAPSTVSTLGSYSQVYSSANSTKELTVYLGWGATIKLGDAVTLAAALSVASRLTGRLAGGSSTVVLQVRPGGVPEPGKLCMRPASSHK